MQNVIALILTAIIFEIAVSVTEVSEGLSDVTEIHENSSNVEDWKSDYELWNNDSESNEEQDLWENENHSNLTSWKMSGEDEVLYDIYSRQPEDEVEENDDDGVELSDDWLVLDIDEELSNGNDGVVVNDIETSVDHVEADDLTSDKEQDSEILDCEYETPKPVKRKKKISNRKTKDEDFYFKHKKYGKKILKGKASQKKKYIWKKNCCIRGKKVGNTRRTFLAEDLFLECQKRTRSLSSRMSKPCRWIFMSCCEARALRRYYIHNKPGKANTC